MMPGLPYVHQPVSSGDLLRAQPKGFMTTHLACVPCRARILITDVGLALFILQHADHIRAFRETCRVPAKPTWRPK